MPQNKCNSDHFVIGTKPRIEQLTPSALTGNVNNYRPANEGDNYPLWRLNGGASHRTITGIDSSGHDNGRLLWICNIGTTNNVVLANESSSSLAAYRIIGPSAGDVTIAPGGSALLMFDSTEPSSARWRVLSVS